MIKNKRRQDKIGEVVSAVEIFEERMGELLETVQDVEYDEKNYLKKTIGLSKPYPIVKTLFFSFFFCSRFKLFAYKKYLELFPSIF